MQISYLGGEVVREGMSPEYHICSRNTCGEIQYWTSVKWYPFFPQYLLHHFVVLLNKGGKKKKLSPANAMQESRRRNVLISRKELLSPLTPKPVPFGR